MKDGALVGFVNAVWLDGSDNLACERSQPERLMFGMAKAGTTAARRRAGEASEMNDIMI
jgi:hypothetical protein